MKTARENREPLNAVVAEVYHGNNRPPTLMPRAFALLELVRASAPCFSKSLIRYDSRVMIEVAPLVRHNQPLEHQLADLAFVGASASMKTPQPT